MRQLNGVFAPNHASVDDAALKSPAIVDADIWAAAGDRAVCFVRYAVCELRLPPKLSTPNPPDLISPLLVTPPKNIKTPPKNDGGASPAGDRAAVADFALKREF